MIKYTMKVQGQFWFIAIHWCGIILSEMTKILTLCGLGCVAVIFCVICTLLTGMLSLVCEIVLRWMSQDLIDDLST